jgi:hypothetical protein
MQLAVADIVRMWRVLPHVARQVIRSRYSSSMESSARRLMAQGRLKHEWPVQDEQQERTVALFEVFNTGVHEVTTCAQLTHPIGAAPVFVVKEPLGPRWPSFSRDVPESSDAREASVSSKVSA